MNNKRDAVVVAYGRSPLAKAYKGSFAKTHPIEYGAQTLKGVIAKLPGFDTAVIDDVIVGCATPERYTGYNIGRLIAQRAGLPDSVPGQTVNRFCSSGLQTVAAAANAIMANQMDVVIAGGIEMMTDMNMLHPVEYQDALLSEQIPGTYISMGLTAENVAERCEITRYEMEAIAVESHRKAAAARDAGKFIDEIIPITVETDNGLIVISQDEGIRPNTNMLELAELKTPFKEDGAVTAATSSQMTDGTGFIILMAREKAEELGYTPVAKFVSFAVGGVAADIMGLGPIVAVPKVMKRTGLTIDDMDVIEINEAFASQTIACIRELKLPLGKINPNGGAMALGHPLGATGTVLTCKALSELKRTNGRYALITMCIGGGMGAAGIFEMEQNPK
ncbi:thiolase family protein [Sedimentibacter hydroxybenzoicus DSM 7310]|uniref:acetyl-CoA C-acyltransferase n=1 Tax=Sedimentibacter hydroxybenzoicus DSM 7310 TaxID=1123245 RepID=A0A974GX49_SEDHY|nr:thiolase family protein [Sedimentibacter hydroxybenzoicus]NYB74710.1 thiolase family protein [Sedimentibacter hydroxybenzoicus DSM 7310]